MCGLASGALTNTHVSTPSSLHLLITSMSLEKGRRNKARDSPCHRHRCSVWGGALRSGRRFHVSSVAIPLLVASVKHYCAHRLIRLRREGFPWKACWHATSAAHEVDRSARIARLRAQDPPHRCALARRPAGWKARILRPWQSPKCDCNHIVPISEHAFQAAMALPVPAPAYPQRVRENAARAGESVEALPTYCDDTNVLPKYQEMVGAWW